MLYKRFILPQMNAARVSIDCTYWIAPRYNPIQCRRTEGPFSSWFCCHRPAFYQVRSHNLPGTHVYAVRGYTTRYSHIEKSLLKNCRQTVIFEAFLENFAVISCLLWTFRTTKEMPRLCPFSSYHNVYY